MSEWKEYKLGDIAKFSYGRMPKKELLNNGIYPTFSGYKYQYTYPEYNCNEGDLIIVARGVGGTGDVKIIREKCYLTNLSLKVEFKEGTIFNDFFYYFFKQETLRYLDSGSAQSQITIQDLESESFLLPDFETQKLISNNLRCIDDKIDLLNRQNTTLEKIAETLFRQWFVEEAKDDWGIDTLSYFADFFNGKSRPNEEGAIPIYGGNGILGFTNKSNYSGKSIIIGRVGAYCGSLYFENKDIWVSDNALLVKAKKENTIHFLFYLLKTLDLNSMAEGSGHPLLTQTLLKSIEIQKPPIQKIMEFDMLLSTIQNKIDSNQTQIRTLTALRDTLLPKLMSGEVRVT